jgi:endogenous inhibitor of DNA gyrase (YacG/DUF329 family)
MEKYVEPGFQVAGFNCPNCGTFSNQTWEETYILRHGGVVQQNIYISHCQYCGKISIWYEKELIYPDKASAPLPSEDLPQECYQDYMEARSIYNKSPRAAAALLRLVVQKLCAALGGKGKNINDDIKTLVGNGLPVTIQQSLDIVRVIGNNAVHPGQIDLNDKPEIAIALFKLINIIVEKMITDPKKINEIYNILPGDAIKSIEKRDNS